MRQGNLPTVFDTVYLHLLQALTKPRTATCLGRIFKEGRIAFLCCIAACSAQETGREKQTLWCECDARKASLI
jgi:hypothetical protein